jgi:chromosome segregation ATPase
LDATTLGSLLVGVGAVVGGVVAYLGKRGENATTRMNSELDQIQEERDKLREQLTARDQKIEGLLEQRVADQVEIARLRVKVVNLGGDP